LQFDKLAKQHADLEAEARQVKENLQFSDDENKCMKSEVDALGRLKVSLESDCLDLKARLLATQSSIRDLHAYSCEVGRDTLLGNTSATQSLSQPQPQTSEASTSISQIFWKNKDGSLRMKNVLNNGKGIMLYNPH
jgi:hypothetical protein